jgi:hypothetical protein
MGEIYELSLTPKKKKKHDKIWDRIDDGCALMGMQVVTLFGLIANEWVFLLSQSAGSTTQNIIPSVR